MFRKARRNAKQILSDDLCIDILSKGLSGVLSLVRDDGYTYGVPLNYVLVENKIYFHTAIEGDKVDALKNNNKVCFTVIDQEEIVQEEINTLYRSVMVFGKLSLVSGKEEMFPGLLALGQKYSGDYPQRIDEEIRTQTAVRILRLDIEYISGKQAYELAE